MCKYEDPNKHMDYIISTMSSFRHTLFCTQQLSSIQLRTLNKERSEIVAASYVDDDLVLTPADVCKRETLLLPPALTAGCMPLHMRPLEQVVSSPQELNSLLARYRGERYLLRVHDQGNNGGQRGRIDVCLRQDAEVEDTMQAVLQVKPLLLWRLTMGGHTLCVFRVEYQQLSHAIWAMLLSLSAPSCVHRRRTFGMHYVAGLATCRRWRTLRLGVPSGTYGAC